LILLWFWLRDEQAAASATPDQQASRSSEDSVLEPLAAAALDPTLLRTTAQDPSSFAAASPAVEPQDSVPIEGRLVFEDGADYPLPFSRVQVITDAPVIGEEVPCLGADEFGTKQLFLVPVTDDGCFSFRIPAALTTATVSAVGPSCVALLDVQATSGIPVAVPMAFFYCGAVSVRDAGSGAPLEEVTNLYLEGGGIGMSPESGVSTGVRSPLAYLRIQRQVPKVENLSTFRQFLTTPKFYEEGVSFKISARAPGFKELEAALVIPGYSGELPLQLVSLQSAVTARFDIVLTIDRPGDWSETETCEYVGYGRFTIHSDVPDTARLSAASLLRPGQLTLRGVPFPDPRLWYEPEYQGRTKDSPKPSEVLLTPPRSLGEPYTAALPIPDPAAFYVPPLTDTVGQYAYFGHVRHSDAKPGWRRYSVRKGLILDGLRPERYRVFWAESYAEITRRIAENLPFADLTLVPGLNRLPAPQ
jgi:hypothetical protein